MIHKNYSHRCDTYTILEIIAILLLIASIVLVVVVPIIIVKSNEEYNNFEEGIVVEKYIRPSYSTTTYIKVNNLIVPSVHFYPESYHFKIKVDDREIDLKVDRNTYERYEVGDTYRKEE